MHKKNKFPFIMLVFTVAAFLIIKSTTDDLPIPSTSKPTIEVKSIIKTQEPEDKSFQEKNNLLMPKQPSNSQLNDQNFFSDDIFINQHIILSQYHHCMMYYTAGLKHDTSSHYLFKNKTVKAKIKQKFKECEIINSQHPEFKLSDVSGFYKTLKAISSKSILEKFFKHEINIGLNAEDDLQFINELKNTDPRLLLTFSSSLVMSDFHMHYSTKTLMELIHSQQLSYILELQYLGQVVYSCNSNGGCDNQSMFMMGICANHEKYCDIINLNEYLKLTLTQGQQADLEITVAYIENLFNSQF